MKHCKNIFLFLSLFAFMCLKGFSQELRIDFKRINSEKAKQKTNGDYLNYLEKEVQKIVHSYGKTSKEYIYLQGFYWDEYHRIYQPYATLNPISIREYTDGRKELLELTKNVYGDTSWVFADAILLHGMNYTGVGNQKMADSTFFELMSLTNKAIQITSLTKAYSEEIRYSNLSMLNAQKGDLWRKIGLRDSAIKYYEIVLDIKNKHPWYDDFFPSFLMTYVSAISSIDDNKGLEFLLRYEPLIKEKYASSKNKEKYYYFLKELLNHYLRSDIFSEKAISFFATSDTLCRELYGEMSTEYVDFTLNYRIPAFKKMGWKSMVYQLLAYLNDIVFKSNNNLLSQKPNLFLEYYLEWYYYYQSIYDEKSGFRVLKWIEKNDIDTSNNRLSFANKITIYRELANYYYYKIADSNTYYKYKVLDLEEAAKKKWGDYVIHQYAEIAKHDLNLFVNHNDSGTMLDGSDSIIVSLAYKYLLLAAKEFYEAYGPESDYFKSVLFTAGELDFYTTQYKKGFERLWPLVYSKLDNEKFVPPLNGSIFQVYGDILNKANKPDSADFFYNQILLRNNAAHIFRVLGTSEDYQIKAFQDIYSLNFLILTQHLQRFKQKGYKYVSSELAEKIFKKNLSYQFQSYINEAIENSTSEQDKAMTNRIKQDKSTYDSLLYHGSTDINLIDSAYHGLDLDNNWLLQSYIVNNSEDSTKFQKLKREYSYLDIRNSLSKGECFIDIIRFLQNDKEFGFSPEPKYAIVLIDKTNADRLEYFFIEDGYSLENAVLNGDFDKVSQALSPLINRLEKYSKIYVNPDGVFNLLNFYALKDKGDEYLIKNKTFAYVNTINGVVEQQKNSQANRSATFLGNPLFNSNAISRTNTRGNYIFSSSAFSNYKELQYSNIEIEVASEVLEKKGWRTKKFLGESCKEERLKSEQAADILHIATHGFYISDSDATQFHSAFESNPYLKSGLVMSAVNNNGKDLNDNVLTAYEVMDMNLKGTSLVVLSACESAKGEIKPGQGIYGLQRAFKIAGAKNVLVSVKNVDDKATSVLMEYFYKNIANGNTYIDALRNAQLQMMTHPLFNEPKYWSNFILIGQ